MSRFKAIVTLLIDLWVIGAMGVVVSYAIPATVNGEDGVWPAFAVLVGVAFITERVTLYLKGYLAYRREVRRGKSTV
jgi:hypothetical protein